MSTAKLLLTEAMEIHLSVICPEPHTLTQSQSFHSNAPCLGHSDGSVQ